MNGKGERSGQVLVRNPLLTFIYYIYLLISACWMLTDDVPDPIDHYSDSYSDYSRPSYGPSKYGYSKPDYTDYSDYKPPSPYGPDYSPPDPEDYEKPKYSVYDPLEPDYDPPSSYDPDYDDGKPDYDDYKKPDTYDPEYGYDKPDYDDYKKPDTYDPEYGYDKPDYDDYKKPGSYGPGYSYDKPDYTKPGSYDPEDYDDKKPDKYVPDKKPDYVPDDDYKDSTDDDYKIPGYSKPSYETPVYGGKGYYGPVCKANNICKKKGYKCCACADCTSKNFGCAQTCACCPPVSVTLDLIYLTYALSLQVEQSSVVVKTFFRSRDQDRDLDKMNSSALESRDHGLMMIIKWSRDHITGCINSNL